MFAGRDYGDHWFIQQHNWFTPIILLSHYVTALKNTASKTTLVNVGENNIRPNAIKNALVIGDLDESISYMRTYLSKCNKEHFGYWGYR